MGLWISKLFHKNDAYRTPVVINPMRTEGNFNINDELELSRERLISTLAYDFIQNPKNKNKLLDKYNVSKYIFTPKDQRGETHWSDIADNILIEKSGLKTIPLDFPYRNIAMSYLAKKIRKIGKNYEFLFEKENDKNTALEKYLKEDETHVTRKLVQTINYLKLANNSAHKEIWGKTKDNEPVELEPADLKKYVELFGDEVENVAPEDIIKFVLPGFFNIDFEFKEDNGNAIKLSELSSGEQQSIFNVNAILYHLYNIQSVHPKNVKDNKSSNNLSRPIYSNVNIVLDEVELYYHPEMQRGLVQTMMKSFENLKSSRGIKAINVCILTHSPFILSDVPAVNVLQLERDSKGFSKVRRNENESFAANINDLLADNFFLNETLVGDFAAQQIKDLIKRIKSGGVRADDDALISLIGDPYLRASLETFKDKDVKN
ncbi:MAG: AAA family ATPase [Flavobacterium sp.]